jgi:hypothetical protein
MGAFHEIQDTIQRITEAIASVIDENLERVAGKGGMRL